MDYIGNNIRYNLQYETDNLHRQIQLVQIQIQTIITTGSLWEFDFFSRVEKSDKTVPHGFFSFHVSNTLFLRVICNTTSRR